MPIISKKGKQMKVGDVVQTEDWPKPATVTKISVILHCDNNMDLVVHETDDVMVVK